MPPGPCEVAEALPAPPAVTAAPRIEARNLAVIFTSFLFERASDGTLVPEDEGERHGLWFAPPGATEARLLAAVEPGGMVLPLGMSQDGETVAVWYAPESRVWGGPTCPSGIYVLATSDGSSRLVMERDWRVIENDQVEAPIDSIGRTWPAGLTVDGETIAHRLPEAAFSANGRAVAFVERTMITVVGAGDDPIVRAHVGECSSWAWSPRGAIFVAGCEKMTSAWVLDVGEGYGEEFYALALPDRGGIFRDWERWWAATIGFTRENQVRVVRFYGFATGCEGPADSGCSIPSPAWSRTTLNPLGGNTRSRSAKVTFLTDVDELGRDARLSADASWVYVRGYFGDRARVVTVGTGEIAVTGRLGDPLGMSRDGRLLFDSRVDEEGAVVLLRSLDRKGTIREIGSIAWPADAGWDAPAITTFGLAAAFVPG